MLGFASCFAGKPGHTIHGMSFAAMLLTHAANGSESPHKHLHLTFSAIMCSWRYQHAARAISAGGVVCHPTEGVWGFACDPLNPEAVGRVLRLKRRSPAQGLILIAHDFSVLELYLQPLNQKMLDRVLPAWPGPVTWLLPAAEWVPDWITGGRETLAVRVTAHPVAAALCRAFGDALVSTSANPSGKAPALHSTRTRAYFAGEADIILAGELQTPGQCSEIRDADSGKLLRA